MSEKNAGSINDIDTTWMLESATLIMFMIPGIGFFYSGLVYKEHALPLIMFSILSLATVSLQVKMCNSCGPILIAYCITIYTLIF